MRRDAAPRYCSPASASSCSRRISSGPDLTLKSAKFWTLVGCAPSGAADQDALISTVAGANPNTVVVLDTGGPMLMPWLDQVKGVLQAW